MSESWPDQVSRLYLMAKDEKWDLSPNDRAAISAALERLADAIPDPPYCDVCGNSGDDLRTPVEVCRDCYDVARDPPPGTEPVRKNLPLEELLTGACSSERRRIASWLRGTWSGDAMREQVERWAEAIEENDLVSDHYVNQSNADVAAKADKDGSR